jgi:hypothetical protein
MEQQFVKRVVLTLPASDARALEDLARRELRSTKAQALILLRESLREHVLAQPANRETNSAA